MTIYTVKLPESGREADFFDRTKAEKWARQQVLDGAPRAIIYADHKKVKEVK